MTIGAQAKHINDTTVTVASTDFSGVPGSSPPTDVAVIGGQDNTTVRAIKVVLDSSDGVAVMSGNVRGLVAVARTTVVNYNLTGADGLNQSTTITWDRAGGTNNQSQTFTATGSGNSLATPSGVQYHALLVVATGAVTSWTVNLQGSLDGTNWTTLLTHTNAAPGGGVTTWPTAANQNHVVNFTRINCSALVLGAGTAITVTSLSK